MFKKALIASAVLAASTGLAFANGGTYMPVETNSGNFYVGIGISADSGVVKNVRNSNTDIGMTGVDGDLYAGYGIYWVDRYYTGLEAFGQVSSNSGKFFGANVKERGQWGIRFQPGLKISDSTMLYADIGWVRGQFRIDGTPFFFDGRSSARNGFQAGLGLWTMIANNVSLRGGWDWNRFQSVNYNNAFFGSGSGRITTQQYHLDLIYHFMA
jgi:opacity protein-like surface antigen